MIALTQERKIALIEHAEEIKDRLSEYGYPFQPHKTKQLMEVAIASLTAEPVAFTFTSDIEGLKPYRWDAGLFMKVGTDGWDEEDAVNLFTVPPVPEIKLPSTELIKEVFLASGFKEKTQPDGSVDLNPYVYDAAMALIKSLNGLGE